MPVVRWSDALSVGNRQIDDDHRHLFALLDKLQDAMRQGKAKAVLADILDELVRYTRQHFSREEDYMLRIGYADYKLHKAEHDRLMAEVGELQKRFNAGALTLSITLNEFLGNWLNTHIMSSDVKLVAALHPR